MLPEDLTEEERRYIYLNNEGIVIFTPVYEAYNELFFDEILKNTGIQMAFEHFNSTAVFERYMLNTAQFSAAKSVAEAKMMQAQVFRDNGTVKGYSEFAKDVKAVQQVSNETWLRTEYEMQRRQTVAIAQYQRFKDDSDLYPYWVYRGRMDGKERPEHVSMEGKVFRIGDPAGDSCFPPNDWNCRCTGDQVDGRYLRDKDVQVTEGAAAQKILDTDVAANFRYNPANVGPMPTTHSYFNEGLPNANAGNADIFGKKDPPDKGPALEGLKARGLNYMINQVQDWRQDHHVNTKDEIVFQNRKTRTNVMLNSRAIHEIGKHHTGFGNLARAIENPSEIWSKWENVGKQIHVLRAYLLFGRISYVVTTLDGEVLDAHPCTNKQIKKYRSGVIIS